MKRIFFIGVIIIFVFTINNLVHSIYSLWQKQDVLINAQKELEQEKVENRTLKKQLSKVKDQQFIEEQARDKLLLVKPGEDVVVVPPELIVGTSSAEKQFAVKKPYWQQWLDLFVRH